MAYTQQDKLDWEVEKLREDVVSLRRPWLSMPTSWISLLAVAASTGGLAFQYSTRDLAKREAEVGRDLALLEKAKVDSERQALSIQVTQLQEQAQLLAKTSAASAGNDSDSAATRAVARGVAEQARETAASIAAFRAPQFTADSGSFAVIASLPTQAAALKYASQVRSKSDMYSVEVYQRAPNRFAVTLGGQTSAAEANRRVEFARSTGIASDAYVRFASDWGANVAIVP